MLGTNREGIATRLLTIATVFCARGVDLIVIQAGLRIDLEVGQDLVGRLGESVLHSSGARQER